MSNDFDIHYLRVPPVTPPRPLRPLSEASDDGLAYRSVSLTAVWGLIFGVLGVFSLAIPLLWLVPLLGVALSALALRRIARDAPTVTGRKAALAGLFLSVVFVVAGPAEAIGYRLWVEREARQFADYWFEFLRQNEPQKAHQLSLAPGVRPPMDAALWEFYRQGPRWYEELGAYVAQPAIRTLLALGPKAEVRFYHIAQHDRQDERDVVEPIYAVTYLDGRQKKTFFVLLSLERQRYRSSDGDRLRLGHADWRIHRVDGGVRPPRLPDASPP
jgi:hypothetical protein